jgi:hypothetical protein
LTAFAPYVQVLEQLVGKLLAQMPLLLRMLDHIALLDMLLAFFQAVTGETGVEAQASHAGPSNGVLPQADGDKGYMTGRNRVRLGYKHGIKMGRGKVLMINLATMPTWQASLDVLLACVQAVTGEAGAEERA